MSTTPRRKRCRPRANTSSHRFAGSMRLKAAWQRGIPECCTCEGSQERRHPPCTLIAPNRPAAADDAELRAVWVIE